MQAPEGDIADEHARDRAAVRGADDEHVGPLAFGHPVQRARAGDVSPTTWVRAVVIPMSASSRSRAT